MRATIGKVKQFGRVSGIGWDLGGSQYSQYSALLQSYYSYSEGGLRVRSLQRLISAWA